MFRRRRQTVSALGEPVENADLAGAFTLENGGTGVIIGTNASAFRLPLYHVVLNFEKGTVTFADLDSELKVYDAGTDYCESFRLIPDLARWAKYNASFAASLAAYLESIDNNAPPPVSGKDGLRELQFEAALRRSAAGRRPVELKEMVLSE